MPRNVNCAPVRERSKVVAPMGARASPAENSQQSLTASKRWSIFDSELYKAAELTWLRTALGLAKCAWVDGHHPWTSRDIFFEMVQTMRSQRAMPSRVLERNIEALLARESAHNAAEQATEAGRPSRALPAACRSFTSMGIVTYWVLVNARFTPLAKFSWRPSCGSRRSS